MLPFSEELFLNACVNECHESKTLRTATNRVSTIINANYDKADLSERINEHCQRLTVTKQEQLSILLTKYEIFSDGSL